MMPLLDYLVIIEHPDWVPGCLVTLIYWHIASAIFAESVLESFKVSSQINYGRLEWSSVCQFR